MILVQIDTIVSNSYNINTVTIFATINKIHKQIRTIVQKVIVSIIEL